MNNKKAGNPTLDFNEVIWEQDIEAIVSNCRTYGIDHITISCNFSGLITTLAEFEKLGCTLSGLTTVNSRFTDFDGNQETLPALIVKIS